MIRVKTYCKRMLKKIPGTCYTNAGEDPNTACVTGIWKYSGLSYEDCANPNAVSSGLWCPTEVTANGDYISGKWGYCDMALGACFGKFYLQLIPLNISRGTITYFLCLNVNETRVK